MARAHAQKKETERREGEIKSKREWGVGEKETERDRAKSEDIKGWRKMRVYTYVHIHIHAHIYIFEKERACVHARASMSPANTLPKDPYLERLE